MHPTATEPTLRRRGYGSKQDMDAPTEIQTTSLLIGAIYLFLGFKPHRVQRFVRSDAPTLFYRMTRAERNHVNEILADETSTMPLKSFAASCAELTEIISRADASGVWNETQP